MPPASATRHGILSQETVLPWEDPQEYETLHESLVAEHEPDGPTESHLVEELAGIMWRKRRLRQAEGAVYLNHLNWKLPDPNSAPSTNPNRGSIVAAPMLLISEHTRFDTTAVREIMRMSEEDVAAGLDKIDEQITLAMKAEVYLLNNQEAPEEAEQLLDEEMRAIWHGAIQEYEIEKRRGFLELRISITDEPEPPPELAEWLRVDLLPALANRKALLTNRDVIRRHVFADAFDPYQLDKLSRYEVSLDRKFERTLTMLVKLKAMRRD